MADADYTCAAGPIPKGTIASVRLCSDGIVYGEPRVSVAIIYSRVDAVLDDWPPHVRPGDPPHGRLTQVTVDGSPHVDVNLMLSGSEQPGVDAIAARVVNSIAATCNASPGLHSPLDLPLSANHTFAR